MNPAMNLRDAQSLTPIIAKKWKVKKWNDYAYHFIDSQYILACSPIMRLRCIDLHQNKIV